MICTDIGHTYQVHPEQLIQFIKRKDGQLVNEGTTNEELLEVLIHRTAHLNSLFPCKENDEALFHMSQALKAFNERTQKRVAQGVETQDKPHVS